MSSEDSGKLIPLPVDRPIWDRVFCVAPLVIVGSKEPHGGYDLAPKHMAMPLGLGNYFCFVCSRATAHITTSVATVSLRSATRASVK